MRFIVRIPDLDSALYENTDPGARQELFRLIRKLIDTGKMVDGGLFADDLGGFLLMEAASHGELHQFLDALFDRSRFSYESHLVLPFKNLSSLIDRMEESDMAGKRKMAV